VINHWINHLERRWSAPAYAGWVVVALSIGLFGAATNTMTGWLYVLSAIGLVLAAISAILPSKSLKQLTVEHLPISPIVAGDELSIELRFHNKSTQAQSLFQVYDFLPVELGVGEPLAIETVPAKSSVVASLQCSPSRRGLFQWDQLELRSGQPLGLFWSRRARRAPAQVWVYPHHFKLAHCPVIDDFTNPNSIDPSEANQPPQSATYGTTRSLRAYRPGDPLRSIHWRSSARYGDFLVRELENIHSAQVITICLNAVAAWGEMEFEQAVVTTASFYFYATAQQLTVRVWTPRHGLLTGTPAILQALAEIQPMASGGGSLPTAALLWLTTDGQGLSALPPSSRYVNWGKVNSTLTGLSINPHDSIANQLRKPLSTQAHG
jgi:uncharacterized protein (DUF58 family)